MGVELLAVSDRLFAAIINGIYQGILVTVLVALSLRGLSRANAATRHAVWLCALLLLVFILGAHVLVISPPDALRATNSARTAALRHQEIDPLTPAAVPPVANGARTGMGSRAPDRLDDWPADHDQPSDAKFDSLPLTSTEQPDEGQRFSVWGLPFPGPAIGEPGPDPSIADVGPATSDIDNRPALLALLARRLANPVALTLATESRAARIAGAMGLGACLTLAAARIVVLLLRLLQIRRLKLYSLPPSTAFDELFQGLVARLRIGRKVALRTSPTAQTSFLLGFFHPVILLPNDDRMEPGEAEQILRHELAHVRRRDDWANLVQHFILAAFPFHPAVWWISRQLSLEREIACDDHVLQSSAPPCAYALLLADLAARMQRPPLLAPGASNNKTQLQQRIDMILNRQRNTSPRLAAPWLAFFTSAATLVAVAVICAAPRIVLAQNDPAPAAANAPSDDPSVEPSTDDAPPVGIVAANFAPEAPEAGSPSATPPKPAAIGPGPKFKPGVPLSVAPPAVSPVPVTPAAPGAPIALTAPPAKVPLFVSADPVPQPRPGPMPHPARDRATEGSLEERLERLERMVESLMMREGASKDLFRGKQPFEKYGPIDRKEIAEIEARAKRQAEVERKQAVDRKEIGLLKERPKHEAARSADEAASAAAAARQDKMLNERAKHAAEGERAARADRKRQTKEHKERSQKQLDVLRQRLEMLEREREKLDREIEELERNQEQLDDQLDQDQSSDAQSNGDEANADSPQSQPDRQ